MIGLETSNLSLERGDRCVLSDISLRFAPGRITTLLGPNGAGKSSLLACLAGLLDPTSGTVLLDGLPVAQLGSRERSRRIGFLPQAQEVHWDIDVQTLVGLGRLPHRGRWGESEDDLRCIAAAMSQTDVHRFAARSVGTLSGGERGRALVARLLAGEPDWLLVDEPLASLDLAHQLDLVRALRKSADQGRGVVLVVHDLQLAQRIADDVVLLRDGKVQAAGCAGEVFTAQQIGGAFGVPVEIVRSEAGQAFIMPKVVA